MSLLVLPGDDSGTDPRVSGVKSARLAQLAGWPPEDRPALVAQATVTTEAWRSVVHHLGLAPAVGAAILGDAGAARELVGRIRSAELPEPVRSALAELPGHLGPGPFAVRSSAVAEDLEQHSYAGQYVTRLGVERGALETAYLECLASAWSPGVQAYRRRVRRLADQGAVATAEPASARPAHQGQDVLVHGAMAVLVQPMVHSGDGWAGAALSDGAGGVVVEAVRGLGEELMSGRADPLRWSVAAGEATEGAMATAVIDWVRRAERRIGHAIEVEFAVPTGGSVPVVLQLRPHRDAPLRIASDRWAPADGVVSGHAVGSGRVRGVVCRMDDPGELDQLTVGGVLVTASTDPRWVPLLDRVAAVVTDHGGLTSHAAIVCRELGLLAVVGCGDATRRLEPGCRVEVRCDAGAGSVRILA